MDKTRIDCGVPGAIALTRKKPDRPQLPNRFNLRNIIPPRDRILVAIAPIFVKLPWKLQLLR
ncbi:hypothetical protein QUB10_18210 [Microcoleus sp. B5-D4]|uniref:hypothetical protein n=1 Tax=unclassified Microcoleus TaxID=2642155 RepID=UPI002FD1E351